MSTQEKLRTFIVDELQPEATASQLTDDYPLLTNGVIDSIGIYQMVGFVESEFGVEIADDELVEDNFGTIGELAALIDAKREETAGGSSA
jgi:acyl carrier protein